MNERQLILRVHPTRIENTVRVKIVFHVLVDATQRRWQWMEYAHLLVATAEQRRMTAGQCGGSPYGVCTFIGAQPALRAAPFDPVSYTHLTLPTSDLV